MPARVLVVGLDAADPQLVRGLAAGGRLPNLASLLTTSGARLENADGFYVGAVWPTLVTGTSPGRHGRCWPGRLHGGTYQVRPFTPGDLGAEPLWSALGRAGLRVGVVDVPHTRAQTQPGVTHVVEWGAHDAVYGFHTSEPSLGREILDRFGRHPVDRCDRFVTEGRLEELRRGLATGVDRKGELARFLLDRDDWDAFFVVFGESHCAGHQFWHLHDCAHPRYDPARREVSGDPLVEVYERLDAALGHVLDGAGSDSEVFVLLSHGMGPHYDGSHLLVEVLRRLEVAWARQPAPRAVTRDRVARVWNHAARRLRIRPRRTWLVDGSRTFFRAPNASLCGAVRLNREGRDPAGTVAPGLEYDDLCSALEAEFRALVNVETGEPAVGRVLRPSELFTGPRVGEMPDLLVEWRQDAPIRSLASPTLGLIEGEYGGHRTGDHRRDGLLLHRGTAMSLRSDQVVDARRLAPTIAGLLGVGLPDAELGSLVPARHAP